MKHPYAVLLACAAAALASIGCSRTRPGGPILRQACDLPVCRTDDSPTDAPCASDVFTDDLGLKRRLERAGHTLMQAKKTTPVADLIKQLARRQCKLAPRRPGQKAMTPTEIYAHCKPSVLIVAGLYKCARCTKWHVGCSSGVLIDPAGVFLTNYHVINNTKHKAMVAMTADGQIYPVAEVLAASAADDVVVARLGVGRRRLPALAVAIGSAVGSRVAVISHPTSRFYTFTTGVISRYHKAKRSGKTAEMMTITADFARGSSGAPILNDRGAVIGLVASTSSVYYPAKKPKKEQLQMVFKQCVPARSIVKLLAPR